MCVIRKQEETGASQRTKIKICGLSRPEDIEAVNEVKPDYAGFVVEVSKSRRNVSVQQLRRLTALLDHGIVSVGVFVNAPVELIVGLLQDGVLAMAQLHGQEDDVICGSSERTDGSTGSSGVFHSDTGGCTAGICQSLPITFCWIRVVEEPDGRLTGPCWSGQRLQKIKRHFFWRAGLESTIWKRRSGGRDPLRLISPAVLRQMAGKMPGRYGRQCGL